jgi:hypothetical protein
MALNSEDAPGPHYKMWNTYEVPADHSPSHILGWAARVAKGAPDGKLGSLVINCHGYYGKYACSVDGKKCETGGGFGLGLGTGIRRSDTPLFSGLKGLLTEIHIIACGAAQISIPGTSGDGDGNLFCCEIAKNAGAYVYASTSKQNTGLWPSIPYGKIDGYEGKVYRWDPDGSCRLTNL